MSSIRRLSWFVILLGSVFLAAQEYQTSFSEVKVDRAKAPSTFHGGVEVEAATGAVTASIPLGPGIGSGHLRFVPTISGRWAPQAHVVQAKLRRQCGWSSYQIDGSPAIGATAVYGESDYQKLVWESPGTFEMEPGSLDLLSDRTLTYRLPSGSSGSSPSSTGPYTSSLPDIAGVANVLNHFEMGAFNSETETIGTRLGTRGELVLGLQESVNYPPLRVRQSGGVDVVDTYINLPVVVLVVEGELAYRFEYETDVLPTSIPRMVRVLG